MGATAADAPAAAATLKRATIEAFERYAAETERLAAPSLADPARFLWVDSANRPGAADSLRKGGLVIERLETRIDRRPVDVPDGLIHHWIGTVFVKGATVDQAVALLQDYNHHAEIYKPSVARSALLDRKGDTFHVFLRFYTKKIITVVINSEHEATFTRPDRFRAYSRIVSTRTAEVENPGTKEEKEKPAGTGEGFMWRLNSNWRFLERDGGTYIQCESMTLTRDLPFLYGWIIKPFITDIPRESLTFTLEATRAALAARPR